ncbi:uncharacterized protein LOC113214824 [Frankliniella occidentalis]|uniref:Uncharacterized protein LOC113214824 n=1 Tax=Frankliniella occidentalis TaxID=133901 RepID=A0A9C6XQH3_FRAOC|nr:uncharacterized protein LOC113214824 [Frankliniella occidentalis]
MSGPKPGGGRGGRSAIINTCTFLFAEGRFTLEALLELNEATVSTVTEYPGEQVILLKRIRNHKANADAIVRPGADEVAQQCSRTPVTPPPPSHQPVRGQKRTPDEPLPTTSAASKKLRKFSDQKVIEDLDLRAVLESDPSSQSILKYYELAQKQHDEAEDNIEEHKKPRLSNFQRDLIVGAIIEHLVKHTTAVDHHLYPNVCEKIVSLFPSEVPETYYIAPREGPKGDAQLAPMGKLPVKLRNYKNQLKNLQRGSRTPEARPSTS